MSKVSDLHKKWSRDPDYRAAYDELGPEFELARSLIEARTRAGLTQEQLARRMDTTQSVIARLESGRTRPSTKTLEKLARATGTRLKISFEATGDAA
ncbi:MAG: helix-turn-helix transcriptional regulator [Alphaproteobacteria bacterium]|nr:helix-turn-helix transcriptional regulator [Alphaproteobacteria bacterium]